MANAIIEKAKERMTQSHQSLAGCHYWSRPVGQSVCLQPKKP